MLVPNVTKNGEVIDPFEIKPPKKTLEMEDFMKLLVTQLSSQDPLNPMQDTAFVSQMTSFTSLEQMKTLTDQMGVFTAQSYIGKEVTVKNQDGSLVTGIVTAVAKDGGKVFLGIDGEAYEASTVVAVKEPAQPTEPAAGDNTSTN